MTSCSFIPASRLGSMVTTTDHVVANLCFWLFVFMFISLLPVELGLVKEACWYPVDHEIGKKQLYAKPIRDQPTPSLLGTSSITSLPNNCLCLFPVLASAFSTRIPLLYQHWANVLFIRMRVSRKYFRMCF